MSYNTPNYTEQGGEKTVIGGVLSFRDGAKLENFPAADNVAANTGTATQNKAVIDAMLLALKKAGLMVGDAMNVSIPTGITYANMATAGTAANSNKVDVTLSNGVITVAVGGAIEDELTKVDHGGTLGKHYWLGFGIRTGFATDAGITFTQISGMEPGKDPMVATLTSADDDEANSVGLASAGDIILYIKAEVVKARGGMEFTLSKDGYKTETFKVVIDETEGE